MTGSDAIDDASDDHERFETELVAQNRDANRVPTADLDERRAHHLVKDLVDAGTVAPIPDRRVLVHEPSGEVFDSIFQLAVFHQGWTTALEEGP